MSLKRMLEETARQHGGKTAIVSGNRRLSYAELDEASDKVANALIQMGVKRGDRVVMLASNSPEFVSAFFGIIKSGAVVVPLDPKYRIGELRALLADCLPAVLVSEGHCLEPLIPELPGFQSVKHVIDLSSTYTGQFATYHQLMAGSSARRIRAEPAPDDIALIAYTSGASFHPAGVMLSHQCLVGEVAASADGFQQTDRDKLVLFALPLHHMLGLVSVLLTSIYKGSTVVMLPGLYMDSLTEVIEKEQISILIGVPFIYTLLVRAADKEGIKHDLSSIRLCCSAGAPLSINVAQRFKQRYGWGIVDCWGLTEAVCLVTSPPIDGSGDPGSVGKALSGWEVKVVGASGRQLPPNQQGEVIVRGPMMMKGYYHNPRSTAEAVKEGWLHTGDIARFDEDGNLFITGRQKDTIIIKGQNVCPVDIEDVLNRHPKVAGVAVMGIPDELRGEVVAAVISLKKGETATESEIKQFCLERLANYKVPKQIFFLDSLPGTTGGEVDKKSIRERLSIPPLFGSVRI